MSTSEAQKKANAKWKKANTKNITCQLSNEEYAAFKAYAERNGKTVSGMMLSYVRSCIAQVHQSEAEPDIGENGL